MKTGIIIPCYNEENRLDTNAFLKFINKENEFHLCFVNDGSTDNTIDVLRKIQESNAEKVSVIDIKQNAGKSAAVRAGAQYLYGINKINYIGFIDADLSTDFNDFGDLLKTLKTSKELNFVFGSRVKDASDNIEKDIVRAFFSRLINAFIVLILGLQIEDTQCGAKVFTSELVPIIFNDTFLSRWLFDVEMFIKLKKHFGKNNVVNKIYEQPLKRWVHMDDSKLGLKDAIEIPFRLVSIWLNYNIMQTLKLNLTENITEPLQEIYGIPATSLAA